MLAMKRVPFPSAVEVVAHEEAAALEIIAKLGCLQIGEIPMSDFNGIKPGPVVNVIVVLGCNGLFSRASIDPGKPSNGRRKMAIRARVVYCPIWAAAVNGGNGAIHETGEHPFRRNIVIGRNRESLRIPSRDTRGKRPAVGLCENCGGRPARSPLARARDWEARQLRTRRSERQSRQGSKESCARDGRRKFS